MKIRELFTLCLGLAFGVVLVTTVSESRAQTPRHAAFSQSAFEKAKADGNKVVLQFHASWCPTCRKQKVALAEILQEADYSKITLFEVNYDNEAKLERDLGVANQSTLILFQGPEEIARSVSVTDKAELRKFLKKASSI